MSTPETQEAPKKRKSRNALVPKPSQEMAVPETPFERLARDPSVTAEKLTVMAGLQERREANIAKAAFAAAFARMQGDIPVIRKDGAISYTDKSGKVRETPYARYEDLDKVLKPILKEYGFALMHKRDMKTTPGQMIITTSLWHEAGHAEETSFVGGADNTGQKNDLQAFGSTDQYGRRYNTVAILNIATGGLDDDGARGGTKFVSAEEAAEVQRLLKESGAEEEKLLAHLSQRGRITIKTVADIPAVLYVDAVLALNNKKKEKAAKEPANA